MILKFKCPACLRLAHRIDGSGEATEIRDLKCKKCGARFRFKIVPKRVRGGWIHQITNTVQLEETTR